MKIVNIFEAKAKLSECLEAAASGERVLICKRNHPVAELRAVPGARTSPRPVGLAAGRLTVPPAFFEPLPEEVASSFFSGDGAVEEADKPPRAAERAPSHRSRSRRRARR